MPRATGTEQDLRCTCFSCPLRAAVVPDAKTKSRETVCHYSVLALLPLLAPRKGESCLTQILKGQSWAGKKSEQRSRDGLWEGVGNKMKVGRRQTVGYMLKDRDRQNCRKACNHCSTLPSRTWTATQDFLMSSFHCCLANNCKTHW